MEAHTPKREAIEKFIGHEEQAAMIGLSGLRTRSTTGRRIAGLARRRGRIGAGENA